MRLTKLLKKHIKKRLEPIKIRGGYVKELDFDELDRAVNSLISPTSTTADSPAPVQPSVDNITTNDSASIPVNTSTNTPTSDSPISTPSTSESSNQVAERRRSGRFMDVVHPSSDMKTASNAVAPRPPRDEIKVTPREPAVADTPVASPAPAMTWPDPIDFHDTKSQTDSAPSPSVEPESQSVAEPNLATGVTASADTSSSDEVSSGSTGTLNSPFIPDAKVEKRPLGAFSGEIHTDTPNSTGPVKTDEITSEPKPEPEASQPPAEPTSISDDQLLGPIGHDEIDTPLPAELQDNVLSIESDSTTSSAPAPTTRDDEPVGPTSITQQYTAQPSSNTEKPGAIFDTNAYHKALKTPAKKKSSWWLVVWIVLLLVVGAGAGAAIYYFVLPAL